MFLFDMVDMLCLVCGLVDIVGVGEGFGFGDVVGVGDVVLGGFGVMVVGVWFGVVVGFEGVVEVCILLVVLLVGIVLFDIVMDVLIVVLVVGVFFGIGVEVLLYFVSVSVVIGFILNRVVWIRLSLCMCIYFRLRWLGLKIILLLR